MNRLWMPLSVCALILSGLLFFKLRKAQDENKRLLAKQIVMAHRLSNFGPESARTAAVTEQPFAGPTVKPPTDFMDVDYLTSAPRGKMPAYRHKLLLRGQWNLFHAGIEKLHLSPIDERKLLDLMTAKVEASIDAGEASRDLGITDKNGLTAAHDTAVAPIEAEILNMIGKEGEGLISHTTQVASFQWQVDMSSGAGMALAGIPMTPEQSTALGEIYAADLKGSNGYSDKNGRIAVDPKTGLSTYDEAIISHAGLILSAAQVQILKDDLIEEEQRKIAAETEK